MKATINGIEVVGTVDEIRQLLGIGIKKEEKKEVATKKMKVRGKRKGRRNRKGKRYPNANKRFSKSEIETIFQMNAKGYTNPVIAKKIGRTKSSVWNTLHRIKLGELR